MAGSTAGDVEALDQAVVAGCTDLGLARAAASEKMTVRTVSRWPLSPNRSLKLPLSPFCPSALSDISCSALRRRDALLFLRCEPGPRLGDLGRLSAAATGNTSVSGRFDTTASRVWRPIL